MSPNKAMFLAPLLVSASALAATDPCAATFNNIATALETGDAIQALGYFTSSPRTIDVITQTAAQPAAASALAKVFRTASIKQSWDSSAVYTATWQASPDHSYPIDIGVQIGITGCVVQAW